MKVVTADQIRELDRLTVDLTGIPWATLMETAGARIAEIILEESESDRNVIAVFCGKGNNGGDGAVIARQLWIRGATVDVFLIGRLEESKNEARANLEIIKRLAEANATSGGGELTFVEVASDNDADIHIFHDVVVDALLGTGLARPAEGLYATAIESINRARSILPEVVHVVSVDIPSGLSSDTSQIPGPCVKADLTVTFTAPKAGNVLPPACDANGRLIVAGIGTPDELLEETDCDLFLVEEDDVTDWLAQSRRKPGAHKGSTGDVLLIAGSRGKTGAAALAAEAVLKAGAGLVTVATSRSAQPLLVAQAPSIVMTEALEELESGAVSLKALDRAATLARGRDVVAIGPGLSADNESTRAFVQEFVRRRGAPVVIDADGLNALAPWPEGIRGSDELPIVITPHPGEMARLAGCSIADVLRDRVGTARNLAISHGLITVLKGQRTLIVSPEGQVCVNPTGNAGMATAGSGDVLTGVIAGLLAQDPADAFEAIVTAVYIHGLAGDMAAEEIGLRALVASDITRLLAAALIRVGGDAERNA